ncbi:MAG: hypothetical protein IAI50_03435, partial [Candidatus Eremiobacteraeota bacterium]|nr:hypothetical protein [Candidatus Eremiobacteraeota bacterium]
MRNRTIAVAVCLFAAIGVLPSGVPAQEKSKLIEFDVPGAKCATSCGTFAYANNSAGTIVGSYTDRYDVSHGFIRTQNGGFTVFDAPGAGLEHGSGEGTVAYSVNDNGAISGQFEDAESVYHGFIRSPNGSFTTIDVPGAGTAGGQGTFAMSINSGGATAGNFIDETGSHGFVRSPAGKISTFDAPNSWGTVVCQSSCLNQQGEVAGYYYVAGYYFYSAFLREPDG